MKTNFDQSSTGTNLSLLVMRDEDLAQMYFDESFQVLQYSSFCSSSVLFYTNLDEFSLEDLDAKNIENKKLARFVIRENYGDDKKAFFDDVSRFGYLKDFDFLVWKELLSDFYSEIDVLELISEHSEPNYVIIGTTGFCQGDYANIIVPKESYNYKNSELGIFGDLIFNQPLCIRLEVDEEEIYLDQELKDLYEYDKEEVLEVAKKELEEHKNKEYVLEWLEENLPEYL